MSEFKHYLMNLKKLNGVIMINNECHSDQLLFELGYLFNHNPNLPIFYANNYNNNLINNNDDNNMVYELLCHYKNLEFHQSNLNADISNGLYKFLYNLSKPNTNNINLLGTYYNDEGFDTNDISKNNIFF